MVYLSKSRKRPWAAWAGVGAATALALTACSSGTSSSSGGKPAGPGTSGPSGTATMAVSSPIPSLDAVLSDQALQVEDSIFDHLVTIDPTGKLIPDLASAWTSNANATQWTFTIRPAKFSNGAPVKVSDVVFSFNAVHNNPKALPNGDLTDMKSIQAVGTNKVEFILKAPYASWPVQTRGISVVPQSVYKSEGPAKFATAPVGSGPYKVVSFTQGGTIKLQANPFYWGPKPAFQTINVVPTLDQSARLTGLQSGSLGVAPLVPEQIQSASGSSSLAVSSSPSNLVVYLGFNLKVAPLNNLKLRQAINLGINRQQLAKVLLGGKATPVGQMVAPTTFGYSASVQPTAFDVAKAKKLVAQSGYKGQPIVFQWATDWIIPFQNAIAQAIQGQLKQIGINVKLSGTTTNTFITDWQARHLGGIYMFSWAPSSMDADAILQGSYLPSSGVSYFSDPQINKLTAQSEAQPDLTKRLALITKIWQISNANVYYAPLFYGVNVVGSVKSSALYTARADGYMHAQDIRKP
jgi:peptide/nickel transport system substrate-binding protein